MIMMGESNSFFCVWQWEAVTAEGRNGGMAEGAEGAKEAKEAEGSNKRIYRVPFRSKLCEGPAL